MSEVMNALKRTQQKELAAALVKAQKQFAPALKTSTNPHYRSKYADLSACVEAVIDALNNNGIYLSQHCHESADGVIVETVFIHESGEEKSCGRLHVPASKQDPQGYGSALTYARRYSLMAACGIAPEDDDGNAASKVTEKKEPQIVVKNNLPEGFIQYEADVLPLMKEAADKGMQALTEEFGKLAKHPCKIQFWTKHGPTLKEQALKAKI